MSGWNVREPGGAAWALYEKTRDEAKARARARVLQKVQTDSINLYKLKVSQICDQSGHEIKDA